MLTIIRHFFLALIAQLNVCVEFLQILFKNFSNDISSSLTIFQAFFCFHHCDDTFNTRELQFHILCRVDNEFILLRLSLFIFTLNHFLSLLGHSDTLLLHTLLNALFHLQASDKPHLKHLGSLIKFFVQLLNSLLS